MGYKYKNRKSKMKNKTRRKRNRMNHRSRKYNMVPIYKGGENNVDNNPSDKKEIPQVVNVSKSLSDLGSGAWNYMTNFGKQVISPEEKQRVEEKLKELLDQNKITPETYKHAIMQINKRDGVLGIKDSMVSILAPVQNMVQVMGDWTLNSNDEKYPAKKTLVKLLWFPKAYATFVKGSIPAENRKDLELDEYMIVVKDVFANPADKVTSDLNSVDNLLANVLNGCIGAGCKNGIVKPPVVLDKSIEITDNIRKKDVLEQMKDSQNKMLQPS
jgi:hypothetical protein